MNCRRCGTKMVPTQGNVRSTMDWGDVWKCKRCGATRPRASKSKPTTVLPLLRNQHPLESFEQRLDAILESLPVLDNRGAKRVREEKFQIVRDGKVLGKFVSTWDVKQALIKLTGKDDLHQPGLDVQVRQDGQFIPIRQSRYFKPAVY